MTRADVSASPQGMGPGAGLDRQTHRAMLAAACTAGLLIAQQVAARAARDALFLSRFETASLPPVMAASAVIGIGSALVAGRFMMRYGPARCVPWLFLLNAGLFVLEHVAARFAPAQVAVVLYLHVAALGGVLASAFWSAVNERFDPYTAKRVMGRIGLGATFGGVLGGLGTARLAAFFSITQLLIGVALLNLGAAAGAWSLRGPASIHALHDARPVSGFEILKRTPYLRDLAWLVGLLAMTDSWVDYVFKAEAGRALGQGQALLGFFALFYTGTAMVTFLVQAALSQRVLRRLGLGGAVAMLPGAIVLAGAIALAAPGLGAMDLLRGLSSVVENSLYRSGYELLYTPLPPLAKRATKALLDVAVARIGVLLGTGVAVLALAVLPWVTYRLLLVACIAVCGCALVLALRLHAGYVAQLASGLRTGAIHLDSSEVLDRTTLRTLTLTATELSRAQLLLRIEAAQLPAVDALGPTLPSQAATRDLIERGAALHSGDCERARAALAAPLAPELVGLALPWLGDEQLAGKAHEALAPHAARCLGQLLDCLLDPTQPLALRRRVPRLLSSIDGERVQRGLFAAREDASFELRERAAQALDVITERTSSVFTETEVFAAARRELARGADSATDPRSIALVFTLLGLCLKGSVARLSLRAIVGADAHLRGTALEYLDNVLPDDVRELLWPRLHAARHSGPKRSRTAIVEDLLAKSHDLAREPL